MPTPAQGISLQLLQQLADGEEREVLPADSPASLKLRLEASFECPAGAADAALFISVADTVVSAQSVTSPQAVLMTVPAEQLRGVRESLACAQPGPQLVRSQLTAFGTLSCRLAEDRRATETVSKPLDLWVDCGEEAAPAEDRPGAESLLD